MLPTGPAERQAHTHTRTTHTKTHTNTHAHTHTHGHEEFQAHTCIPKPARGSDVGAGRIYLFNIFKSHIYVTDSDLKILNKIRNGK